MEEGKGGMSGDSVASAERAVRFRRSEGRRCTPLSSILGAWSKTPVHTSVSHFPAFGREVEMFMPSLFNLSLPT